MSSQGFPRGCRLHLKNDFKSTIHDGKRIQGPGLVLWWKPAPLGTEQRRLGLVVSRKLGHAVVRNRVKRLLREAFRLNRERLSGGVYYIFSPRNSETLATLNMAEKALLAVCQRAGLLQAQQTIQSYGAQNE
ncbi:MAG: ribonuclease P protein component [Elusimicrobiaceae bacterium]|nr:ribonuclease P protein component [Elusimicrobiaceae bacterium]